MTDEQQRKAGPDDSQEPAHEEQQPRITLDHYHITRRRARRPTWPYLVSMVFMLAALIVILLYSGQCSENLSRSLFQGQ